MQYVLDGEMYFEVMSISRDDLEQNFADDDIAESVKKLTDEDINAIAEHMGRKLFTTEFWRRLDEATREYLTS
jgi:hypothetical protein